MKLKTLFISFSLFAFVFNHTADEWADSRVIYQLLTDRFGGSSETTCSNLGDFCGGTWKGITEHLDYIADLGFNAIWISPVNQAASYHAYDTLNFYQRFDKFGSDADLKALIQAAHEKDIWIMFDVIANHVGPNGGSPDQVTPFNKAEYYHPKCEITDWNNQTNVEMCRLSDLPDLMQENIWVKNTLVQWISDLANDYGIDGIRIDTIPEVPIWFWQSFAPAAGVYSLGEVFNGNVDYVANYANNGGIGGTFSYPMKFTLDNVFGRSQSCYNIRTMLDSMSIFKNPDYLGSFLDNHDNPRFLSFQSDWQKLKNAVTFSLFAQGIPVVYYGTEQGFNGAQDPYCREPLWTTNYNKEHELYKWMAPIVNYRKSKSFRELEHIERYVNDVFYAFSRGSTFIALTNKGSGNDVQINITYHPYQDGDKLCRIDDKTDIIIVESTGFNIYLKNGEPKVYDLC